MGKKAQLPALFVEAASDANEHASTLRDQLRRHREFLVNNDLKSIPRAIYLDVIDSIEQLAGNVLAHPSLEKWSEDLLEKWLKTYQSLAHTIAANGATTSQIRTKAHQLDGPPGDEDPAAASDFKLVVKLSDKGVVARLRGIEPQLILKEANSAIRADKGILEEYLPIVVQGLKQLRSGDFEIHTEKVEHVRILQAAMHWVSVFGANTRVHVNTYGVLAHCIRPKSLDLGNPSKICKPINKAKLSLFTKPESITYIGWLKADIMGLKCTSIKVEFDIPELANEVIRKGLNWDGQPHTVERYATQGKIMQCFNYQSYGHIGNRCLSTTKCAKCADHHDTKPCTATHRRCPACQGAHPSRSNHRKARRQEKERMKRAISGSTHLLAISYRQTFPVRLQSCRTRSFARTSYRIYLQQNSKTSGKETQGYCNKHRQRRGVVPLGSRFRTSPVV